MARAKERDLGKKKIVSLAVKNQLKPALINQLFKIIQSAIFFLSQPAGA